MTFGGGSAFLGSPKALSCPFLLEKDSLNRDLSRRGISFQLGILCEVRSSLTCWIAKDGYR